MIPSSKGRKRGYRSAALSVLGGKRGEYVVEIRDFKPGDMEALYGLIKNELGYAGLSISGLTERLGKMYEGGDYHIFAACENNKMIGFIGLSLGLALEIEGTVMRIIGLAVEEECQGMGVGSALISKAEEFADENGVSVIFVNSGLKREAAHRFYEKNGFGKKGYGFSKYAAE